MAATLAAAATWAVRLAAVMSAARGWQRPPAEHFAATWGAVLFTADRAETIVPAGSHRVGQLAVISEVSVLLVRELWA